MNFNEMREKSQLFNAIHTLLVSKKVKNHHELKSGRFTKLERFTKVQNYLLECLYTINDIRKPTSYRLYLYLLRQITGYKNKSSIELRPNIIKKKMNIGNNYYEAIKDLKDKNMINVTEKDGVARIHINPYPDTWVSDSHEELNQIITKEINHILGKNEDDNLESVSSSSWSSSGRSSSLTNEYNPVNREKYDPETEGELLKELDELNDNRV
jgi:hypothetical protein